MISDSADGARLTPVEARMCEQDCQPLTLSATVTTAAAPLNW